MQDYLITPQPRRPFEFTVWKAEALEPYLVMLGPKCTCTCPHWVNRLEPGRKCKHILMASTFQKEDKEAWYELQDTSLPILSI
jgi:hypothetical protein